MNDPKLLHACACAEVVLGALEGKVRWGQLLDGIEEGRVDSVCEALDKIPEEVVAGKINLAEVVDTGRLSVALHRAVMQDMVQPGTSPRISPEEIRAIYRAAKYQGEKPSAADVVRIIDMLETTRGYGEEAARLCDDFCDCPDSEAEREEEGECEYCEKVHMVKTFFRVAD